MSWTIHRKKFTQPNDEGPGQPFPVDCEHVLAFDGHGSVLIWCGVKPGLEKEQLLEKAHFSLLDGDDFQIFINLLNEI